MTTAQKLVRAGRTDKISVSIDRKDLALIRKRARRLYGGNLSAVVAEGVKRVQEEEGREALVSWLAEAGQASPAERAMLRAEWRERGSRSPRRKAK
ncbi:MAG TPA: hypothetical protein VGI10_18180 [Polyangiaceae bacterium]|jgi:hypothetical protein